MSTRTTRSKKTTSKVAKKAPVKSTKSTAKKAPAAVTKRTTPKASKVKSTKAKAVKTTGATATKKRPVIQAPDEKSFWTTDGQVLNSIVALNNALEDMQKAVYQYHVAKDRHDFADWVESVLCDAECAAALRRAKTPKTARTVVVRHLKFYTL